LATPQQRHLHRQQHGGGSEKGTHLLTSAGALLVRAADNAGRLSVLPPVNSMAALILKLAS
jgi:hypothetical protein